MPIKIVPVCHNCRGAIEAVAPDDAIILGWVHADTKDEFCNPMAGGLAGASPTVIIHRDN